MHGLVAAPFTPFRSDGTLALDLVPRLAAQLAANGLKGAFICGTTGEGVSLTSEERRQLAAAWRQAITGQLQLIIHVGHASGRESCALARHAEQIGADAIAAISPSFFKPPGVKELVAWCRDVAAAAPTLPFYYYHMPVMTGVAISATEFLDAADGRIPTLAGVKFTHEDLQDYRAAVARGGNRYNIMFGRDEILLDGLEAGAVSAVGSTYNYMVPIFHRVLQAWTDGDLTAARHAQAQARTVIDIMSGHGGLSAGKAIMKLIGCDCGPMRLPLPSLDANSEAALRTALQTVGFFEFANVAP